MLLGPQAIIFSAVFIFSSNYTATFKEETSIASYEWG